jgi:hypothetical protein
VNLPPELPKNYIKVTFSGRLSSQAEIVGGINVSVPIGEPFKEVEKMLRGQGYPVLYSFLSRDGSGHVIFAADKSGDPE